jgi:hypothetical protein
MSHIYDPNRVSELLWIQEMYSEIADVGSKVRFQFSEDPCRTNDFRGSSSTYTITEVDRREGGFVKFRAISDEDGREVAFTNTELDPSKAWEVLEKHYRGEEEVPSLEERLTRLEEKMREMSETNKMVFRAIADDFENKNEGHNSFLRTYSGMYDLKQKKEDPNFEVKFGKIEEDVVSTA